MQRQGQPYRCPFPYHVEGQASLLPVVLPEALPAIRQTYPFLQIARRKPRAIIHHFQYHLVSLLKSPDQDQPLSGKGFDTVPDSILHQWLQNQRWDFGT